jgi:hypothetical protein
MPADRGAARPQPSVLPTWGWVSVAAGAVALGTGVYFFADGRSKISEAHCPDQICVRGIGDKSLHDSGRSHEKLGLGFGIAGVALGGLGVSLLLLAPPARAASSHPVELRLAASGLDLRGAF